MSQRAPRFQAPARTAATPAASPPTDPTENPPRGGVPHAFQARTPVKRLASGDALTKDQAAAYAGVTKRTITRWIGQGSLNKYVMKMNRVAVSKVELDALLTARYISGPQA